VADELSGDARNTVDLVRPEIVDHARVVRSEEWF
jgi:hypothetical protein